MDKLVEELARVIYDAPDTQSGDYVGTVIYASEHLFVDIAPNESSADATQRTSLEVCRDAARAILPIIHRERLEAAKRMQAHIGNMVCTCFDCVDSIYPAAIIGDSHDG